MDAFTLPFVEMCLSCGDCVRTRIGVITVQALFTADVLCGYKLRNCAKCGGAVVRRTAYLYAKGEQP